MASGSGARKKQKNVIIQDELERSRNKRVGDDEDEEEELSSLLSEWIIDINEFLEEGGPRYVSHHKRISIFRVPDSMRKLQPTAYRPKMISIGPFHANADEEFEAMEEHKIRYLLRILARGTQVDQYLPVLRTELTCVYTETLLKAMKKLEKRTRNCYSELDREFSSDEFVLMMLYDGCFVIELLRLHNDFLEGKHIDDQLFLAHWMLPALQRDLLNLENQLPLFVLDKLYKLTAIDGEPSLTELALKFFDAVLPREERIMKDRYKMKVNDQPDHLLSLFRTSFITTLNLKIAAKNVYTAEDEPTPVEDNGLVRTITELQEAGVEFKKRNNCELLDIKFEDGVFHIPPLMIDEYTKSLFLNFVAYEQCCPYRYLYFTNYVVFFDTLVNSPKDVEILRNEGIINSIPGSEREAADIFNNMAKELIYDARGDGYDLSEHLKKANVYARKRRNLWRAKLMRDYFNSPWAFLSVLAAIILLLLTIAQTIFSALSYFRPPSPH